MKLVTHIFSPDNTGSPDYDICGQAALVVNFTNVTLRISISDGTTTQQLLSTTNLAGALSPSIGTYTFGNLDVDLTALTVNSVTGSVLLDMDFYKTGTTDVCTWEKIFITIEVIKTGYQSFTNIFEIYGYDIGNDATLALTGNPQFDIYLINDTDNVVNGIQTKAFSNISILRQPFTDNIFVYNMVGTQGTITYYEDGTTTVLGSGRYTKVCLAPDSCGNNELSVEQKIQVFDSDCTLLDTCEFTATSTSTIWLPTVTSTSSCPDACNDCINNISAVTVSTTVDYEKVTPFKINGTLVFLTQFMEELTIFKLYDFQNIEIDDLEDTYTITYAAWILDKATYLIPIEFVVTTPPLGDCKVVITHKFTDTEDDLVACNETIPFTVCNWWTVTKGEECGDYIFNNCSDEDIDIVLQKFNDDKTFTDLSTTTVAAGANETISIQSDGIYVVKVPSRDTVGTFEYYTITSFCNVEACWLNYLNTVICNKPTDDCKIDDHYKFNAFLINAHTFFMAINEEFNFSFIYTVIDDDKLDTLYTLSSFITRFTEYCNPSDSACLPCQS